MAQVNLKVTSPQSMGTAMTVDSVNELGIKEGNKVKLLIKAISVLVVKED